jgi:hypothetical protein
MANSGREPSRGRDPRRAEIKKKIKDLAKIADDLEKSLTEDSQQFKELQNSARDLRKIFDEVDNELGDRESSGVPGHVKDNDSWIKARTRIHQVYHAVRSHLEQKSPPDEGIKLAPFEPRKLKVTESQSKKKDGNEESGENGEEHSAEEEGEQGKAALVISTHRSEVPTDVAALTRFLERKEVVFQKKMNGLTEARDNSTKMAHVRILQRLIGQAGRYKHEVNTLLPEETKNDEQEALLETWETFRDALEEAVALVDPFSAKPPKTEEEGHQKRVKDWLYRDEDGGRHDSEDAGKGGNSSRRNYLSDRQRCRSSLASSPMRKEVRSLVAKSMADDALKSVPQFSGGHEEFIDWQQAAQTFIDAGYFSAAAAFQLLKKTLDGKPKKLVDKMSLQEPELLEKMMKKLKKEYADPGQLAVLQKQKIAKHPTVGYSANNLQEFYDLVERTYSILVKTERVGDEKEFIGLVLTRLPRTYQNRIDDALDGRNSVKLLLKAMEKPVDREKDAEWRNEALGLEKPQKKDKRKKDEKRETRRKMTGRRSTSSVLQSACSQHTPRKQRPRSVLNAVRRSTTCQTANSSRNSASTND